MANEYRAWYAPTKQEWVTQCYEMLEHLVGWYRVWTYSDTASDRRFSFVSEGERNDKLPPRLMNIYAATNWLSFDMVPVAADGFNFFTGSYGSATYVGTGGDTRFLLSTIGRSRTVGNKDRLFVNYELAGPIRYGGYVGYIDSFYSPLDDSFPALVRATEDYTTDYWTTKNTARMLHAGGTEVDYKFNWDTTMVDEGYPNKRSNEYTFKRPELYYADDVEFNEVRGRPKGLYYGKQDRLANGSFVNIDGDYYLVTKSAEVDAVLAGPVSSNGQVPNNYGWMPRPNLKVDYTYRGMLLDTATSGTLSLWRFDTGHLGDYVYGSEATLPVPTTYPDTATNYTLTAQNGLTSVKSRLREAASFNGSTHYASAVGDSEAAAALKEEWTFECVFKPSTIPTTSDVASLIDYGSAGSSAVNNTLLCVSVAPAVGSTPDSFNVERGNVSITWEKATNVSVNSLTSGDFIQQNRWNYLAIVKKYNGLNYDIDVWHCSFGDHVVPTKKATFTNLDNSTSGTSSGWYVGVDESLTNYFDGQIDDTRVTERVLTEEEILESCSRSML